MQGKLNPWYSNFTYKMNELAKDNVQTWHDNGLKEKYHILTAQINVPVITVAISPMGA